MRIRFDTNATGGLRVISDIPDHPLCRLEGRNGVGKTVAVRLLELSTGGRPYLAHPAAWRSLKEHLGTARITIEGLQGGDKLELVLRPEMWPEDPPSQPTVLGDALLNGRPIQFLDVPSILSAVRIGGDETIITQIRNRLEQDKSLLRRQNARLESKVSRLEELLDRVTGDVSGLSPRRFSDAEQEEHLASVAREQASTEYRRATETLQRYQELGRLVTVLNAMVEQEPVLNATLAQIEDQLRRVEDRRSSLEIERQRLLPEAEREQRLLATVSRLSKSRDRLVVEVKDMASRATGATLALGLSTDETALQLAAANLEAELRALNEDRATLSVLPDLAELIRRVNEPLGAAAEAGLAAEVIAILGRARVTVEQLHEALSSREAEVSNRNQPQRSLYEEIDEQIRALKQRASGIREAQEYLSKTERAQEKLNGIATKLREALDAIQVSEDKRYREILSQMAELDAERLALIERRADLRYQRSILEKEGSRAQVEARVTALRAGLGLTSSLRDELQQAQTRLDEYRFRLRAADDALAQARSTRLDLELKLEQRIGLLEHGPDYSWLRATVPDLVPSSRFERSESLRRISVIAESVTRLQSAIDVLTRSVARVSSAADVVLGSIGKSQASAAVDVLKLTSYYEAAFESLLRDPEIQATLFNGGVFDHLDLVRAELSWKDIDGEPVRRPIEAFSSGERAFAYVLASVLQHTNRSARNRILILDEFGAFIEADRLDQLLRFLQQRVLQERRADQVVIILPLRMAEPAISDRTALLQAISERGYFAQEVHV